MSGESILRSYPLFFYTRKRVSTFITLHKTNYIQPHLIFTNLLYKRKKNKINFRLTVLEWRCIRNHALPCLAVSFHCLECFYVNCLSWALRASALEFESTTCDLLWTKLFLEIDSMHCCWYIRVSPLSPLPPLPLKSLHGFCNLQSATNSEVHCIMYRVHSRGHTIL